jgi:hypothetical protein
MRAAAVVCAAEILSYDKQMANIYRIFPVLWNDGICKQAQTVYAIDRPAAKISSTCSSYVREDPAYYWSDNGGTFQRLLPPQSCGGCYQPPSLNAVTWQNIPSWLSYAASQGYTLQTKLTGLKPYSEIYIMGP